ncbi:metal ABC transporter ATP-binding protein [Halovivax limisalsi]|uniref:metal ABC transporter ATP-binding protein n=1 Tax=Halovivax limisalsi TaxID=1453760 RepID=UPI001FFD52E3|nr:metal ABC transporter ATP-binding protein [Halovivax limisalsi]
MSAPSDAGTAEAGPEPIVRFEDVSFGYGDRPVLESISLEIEPGAFLGVVGPNGSGKSTLLDLLLGLRRPDSGCVTLFGDPAHAFEAGERIGYVPQDVAHSSDGMPITVREVVAMGRYPRRPVGRFDDDDRRAIDEALAAVDIGAIESRRVGRLSGGQRQRVFVARALAADADLLVLDEPTVGVDASSRSSFYDLLGELHASGLTVVLVEHDVGVVTSYATAVACLDRQLHFHGDPEEFAESDAIERAYGTDHRVLHHDH